MANYSNLPYDILHCICLSVLDCSASSKVDSDLLNLSFTDHRTREITIPILFQHLSFQSKWGKMSKEYLDDVIEAIRQNNRILWAVRKVTLRDYIYQCAVEEFPAKLGRLLFELPQLSTLIIDLPFKSSASFVNALKMSTSGNTDSAMLPSVHDLTIQDYQWQCLTQLFPNLQSLIVKTSPVWRSPIPLLDIAALGRVHPQLRRLHCSEVCGREILEGAEIDTRTQFVVNKAIELAEHLPLVEDLGFLRGYPRGFTKDNILNHIPYLKGLRQLKRLSLPRLLYMGLSFSPPLCGNAYFNNPGLRERVTQDRKDAHARLIQALETHLTTDPISLLESISMGFPGSYSIYEVGKDRLLR